MNTITHASVFSGIGGPEVAAVMLGWENLFFCEINPFGKAVLDYWFPNSKSYEDITTTDFSEWRGKVTVLTGGFPCQPFSYAGQRRGSQDDRYLWPYMFRCIDQIQPDWVVAENVAGILTMVEQGEISEVASTADLFDTGDRVRGYRLRETFTLQRICDDLESHGYTVQPVLIPACAVGAPHRRDRVFIIGHRRDAISGNTDGSWAELSEKREVPTRSTTESRRVCARGCKETNAAVSQDPVRSGQLVGHDEEQWSERNERNAGARGGQWLRGETSRPALADTDLQRRKQQEPTAEPSEEERQYCQTNTDGRDSKRNVTDTSDAGSESVRQEWQDAVHRLRHATDTESKQGERMQPQQPEDSRAQSRQFGGGGSEDGNIAGCGRWQGFPTVSPVHRGNDGLPFDVDCLAVPPIPAPPTYGKGDPQKYPFAKWRTEALKAYGNAIVPQVMY